MAARVLEKLGIDRDRLATDVEGQMMLGDTPSGRDLTLTPRAKKVVELAIDEARNLANDYVGTEHLLLGLIREGDGLAGRVLAKSGAMLELARNSVIALRRGPAD
jgi:ATP-dependent Clp protease ATP-binding subunit ClpC